MGFGYKTAWIAVHHRSTIEVADALNLARRRMLSYPEGTALGYRDGVYVAAPHAGWTFAHGRALSTGIDPTSAAFVAWLAALSRCLGEVQYFGTHRVSESHQWAWARDGQILRAYAFADADVPVFLGPPTDAEREIGVGVRPRDEGWQQWTEDDWDDWDDWFTTTPGEQDVMQIARRWSIDPTTLDDD